MMNLADTSTSSCQDVQNLRSLILGIQKGIDGAGIRRELRPETLMRVAETLKIGNTAEISALMKDIAGQALSLGAGQSKSGIEATEAICEAQAECLVQLRNKLHIFEESPSEYSGAQSLIQQHMDSLLNWVETGVVGLEDCKHPSDLTKIGQHFLTTSQLRMTSISVFIASLAVMRVSLGLFTSQKI